MFDLSSISIPAWLVFAAAAMLLGAGAAIGLSPSPRIRLRAYSTASAAILLAAAGLVAQIATGILAPETVEAQESTADGAFDEKSGLITPPESGSDVRIVTTETVPGPSSR